MTSCAEWTGVLLSVLLKEAGVQDGGTWIVAEGVEEVKGRVEPSDGEGDGRLYPGGLRHERRGDTPPARLPAAAGGSRLRRNPLTSKWLRRVKVVDRYYMTYNDYGHLNRRDDPEGAALGMYQIGPKSVITFPSGGQQLPGRGFYEVSGLSWSGGGAVGKVEVSTDGGRQLDGRRDSGDGTSHGAYPVQLSSWNWDGQRDRAPVALHGRNWARFNRRELRSTGSSTCPSAVMPAMDNSIQPWRIASDGSVHNAIA